MSQLVHVGGLVSPGCVVLKALVVQEDQHVFSGVYESIYRMGSPVRDEPCQPIAPARYIELVWDLPVAGKVVSSTAVGTAVRPGSVVLEADCRPLYQRLALLREADVLLASSGQTELNEQYQERMERFISLSASGRRDEAMLLACMDLEQVVQDFMETATTYARVIINELHLPLEQKTLRPVSMGGSLGGSKFIVRGVLFKIPDGDIFKNYPDPIRIAQKICGHELKGEK